MNFCSPEFFISCCLVPILFHQFSGKLPRQLILSGINLAFLWTFVPNLVSWLGFALFICGTYSIVLLVRRRTAGFFLLISILGVLAAFIIIKKYTFIIWVLPENIRDHKIAIIGISYMLFKFIHVLVDSWQGQLERLTFSCYANYQLSFFTLVAGPIQRYNDFHKGWELMDAGPSDKMEILLAWNRLLTGFIKMGGLAVIAKSIYDWAIRDYGSQLPSGQLILRFLVIYYFYIIYLYFNFSGYTDIAIGSARLFGFELPENFNWPFIARNVLDFWNRWHITLTHWIRDYVFMTTYKFGAEHFPRFGKQIGYMMLFTSLFLSGVWHGSTMNFAIWGFIHGIGAMATQIYGDLLKRYLGRARYHRYQKSEWIRWIAIIVTFHYVCFALLFFAMEAKQAISILVSFWTRLI
jgi:alginate O-acetyltransferase complex protein AlgI